MSLEDGLRLVTARGRLMQSLPPDGEMAAIMADEAYVTQLMPRTAAKCRSRRSTAREHRDLRPGSRDAVGAVDLAAANIEVRPLAIPIAAHSPQVDPILDAFERWRRSPL